MLLFAVALYERAWIEIFPPITDGTVLRVALYERAWIEIKVPTWAL